MDSKYVMLIFIVLSVLIVYTVEAMNFVNKLLRVNNRLNSKHNYVHFLSFSRERFGLSIFFISIIFLCNFVLISFMFA
jgi:hypothetical protein